MVTTTSPTSPSATGSPVPGRTISTISVLVDDHALSRLALVGDDAGLGDRVALQHRDAALPSSSRSEAGSAAPETSARLNEEASLPVFSAVSSRILRKSGVPT